MQKMIILNQLIQIFWWLTMIGSPKVGCGDVMDIIENSAIPSEKGLTLVRSIIE